MKDRAEYAQKGIARGRSLVATTYDDGIAIVAENPSRSLHKISEIYDRIAFAGVGKYNEYDQLRVAGVRHADTKGFAFSREDVDARSLANLYAQYLGNVFTHEMKPLEVEILVAELGATAADQLYHIAYEGTITDEDHFAVLGGDAETITERVAGAWQADWDMAAPIRRPRRPWPGPTARWRRRPGGGRPEPGQRPPDLPADPRRRAGATSGIGSSTVGPVERRIFGVENEYGVTFTLRGQRRLSPDEVARYLFRRVVVWGRSSNVFLENGARLYLDVGSHPEYATPECDRIGDVVVHDKAGEWILAQLVTGAQARLREEGIRGDVYLFKNNTDSVGNSYGCHENYLTERNDEFNRYTEVLIPFLVVAADLRRGRQGAADGPGRRVLPQPAGRAHLGGRVVGHHPEPPHHQHPGRAARRRRALPPPARDRRRLQHERVRHLPEDRHDDHPAGHARGLRRPCCATSRWRTPSGPSARSATTSPASGGSAWPTAARCGRSTSRSSTSSGR